MEAVSLTKSVGVVSRQMPLLKYKEAFVTGEEIAKS
jgi:hypothetical protein